LEEVTALSIEYWNMTVDYVSHPGVVFQLGLILVLFLPAWFLSTRVEPALEERARKLRGMPGALRVIVAFLRRMERLFFTLLLGVAYLITSIAPWPENNYLIYSAMLLAGAWLLISVGSHAIRKRIFGKLFALVVWIFAAASILGIVDDIAGILDSIGFSMGSVRLSVLSVLQAIIFVGALCGRHSRSAISWIAAYSASRN
jgi:hypothetical protein